MPHISRLIICDAANVADSICNVAITKEFRTSVYSFCAERAFLETEKMQEQEDEKQKEKKMNVAFRRKLECLQK